MAGRLEQPSTVWICTGQALRSHRQRRGLEPRRDYQRSSLFSRRKKWPSGALGAWGLDQPIRVRDRVPPSRSAQLLELNAPQRRLDAARCPLRAAAAVPRLRLLLASGGHGDLRPKILPVCRRGWPGRPGARRPFAHCACGSEMRRRQHRNWPPWVWMRTWLPIDARSAVDI
jgi:hypothetical protein